MTTFERSLQVPVPRRELYDWHLRPGAFERLLAPWSRARSIRADPVANGAKRIFEIRKGGLWMRWVASHHDVVAGREFTDVQERGPFKQWRHIHGFEAVDERHSRLVDRITYELPWGWLGRAVAGRGIRADLERMFAFRHRVTAGDLSQHALFLERPRLRIAVSGASGLIGRQLVAYLTTGGHRVMRLVRRDDAPAADEIRWSAATGVRDLDRLEAVDAVVHLAGAPVAQRWDEAARRRIEESRVLGTRTLVDALGQLDSPPGVFLGASAVGYYGDTGGASVDEKASRGDGFLADVCGAWEAETLRARGHGCRTVLLRIGVVMDPRGGALAKLLPVFRAGLGGRVGSGRQLVSWVGLDDVLGAVGRALHDEGIEGAVNVTGPTPVPQAELARTLGRVLTRPALAPVPACAIRLLYGEMGAGTVLASTGARPGVLLERGYGFRARTLEEALRHCLGRGAAAPEGG